MLGQLSNATTFLRLPGSYSLNFVAPTGYTFTTKDQGSDALDSDVDSSGKTIQTVLTSGESDLTWDAGPKFVPAPGPTTSMATRQLTAPTGTSAATPSKA